MTMLQQMQRLQDSQDKRQLQQRKQSLQRRSNSGKLTNAVCSARLLQRCLELGVFEIPGTPPSTAGSVGATTSDAAAPSLPIPYEVLHSLVLDLVACTSSGSTDASSAVAKEECDWELCIVGILLHRQMTMPLLLAALVGTHITALATAPLPRLHARNDFVALFTPLVALLAHAEVRVQHEAATAMSIYMKMLSPLPLTGSVAALPPPSSSSSSSSSSTIAAETAAQSATVSHVAALGASVAVIGTGITNVSISGSSSSGGSTKKKTARLMHAKDVRDDISTDSADSDGDGDSDIHEDVVTTTTASAAVAAAAGGIANKEEREEDEEDEEDEPYGLTSAQLEKRKKMVRTLHQEHLQHQQAQDTHSIAYHRQMWLYHHLTCKVLLPMIEGALERPTEVRTTTLGAAAGPAVGAAAGGTHSYEIPLDDTTGWGNLESLIQAYILLVRASEHHYSFCRLLFVCVLFVMFVCTPCLYIRATVLRTAY